MTGSLILDTHALLWLLHDDAKLGKKAAATAQKALEHEKLAVSAISFWEIGMLAAKGRLEFELPLKEWRVEVLRLGIQEWPVTGEIGVLANELTGLHGDPADRLIAATALTYRAGLLTADRDILTWKNKMLKRLDARA